MIPKKDRDDLKRQFSEEVRSDTDVIRLSETMAREIKDLVATTLFLLIGKETAKHGVEKDFTFADLDTDAKDLFVNKVMCGLTYGLLEGVSQALVNFSHISPDDPKRHLKVLAAITSSGVAHFADNLSDLLIFFRVVFVQLGIPLPIGSDDPNCDCDYCRMVREVQSGSVQKQGMTVSSSDYKNEDAYAKFKELLDDLKQQANNSAKQVHVGVVSADGLPELVAKLEAELRSLSEAKGSIGEQLRSMLEKEGVNAALGMGDSQSPFDDDDDEDDDLDVDDFDDDFDDDED